jgi:hypothetical protein
VDGTKNLDVSFIGLDQLGGMSGLTLLRAAIGANVVYFVAMAFAHFNGLKYPILFIYWDVPYHEYQVSKRDNALVDLCTMGS